MIKSRLFLCVLCALCGKTPVRAEAPHTIRVITYNIHHGEGTDGKIDLERIAKVLLAESPDVVALNEVDQGTQRTNRIDMPAELARLTGMTAVFEKNIDFEGGKYGNAVLTRLPIVRHENHKLPSHYEGEQRGVLEVELGVDAKSSNDASGKVKKAGSVLFFATHLDYRPEDHERMASVARIKEILGQRTNQPAILAGDLNAAADSAVMAAFAKNWKRTNAEVLPTYPAAEPNNQIDYILVRPADQWNVMEVRVLDEAVASDHRGLLAVLRRKPTPESTAK